jgi:CspA family cold shock protein
MNGTIKRLVSDKGFGSSSRATGTSIFHNSACTDTPFNELREGQTVTFERGQGRRPRGERQGRLAGSDGHAAAPNTASRMLTPDECHRAESYAGQYPPPADCASLPDDVEALRPKRLDTGTDGGVWLSVTTMRGGSGPAAQSRRRRSTAMPSPCTEAVADRARLSVSGRRLHLLSRRLRNAVLRPRDHRRARTDAAE